ncbi:divalent-cation tolerance protein CutA [Kitasatospora sp. NBC_00240]|uniref:divalent-cation tolerance protein CutA n=1 Tax=Kitasatospora sp. NBC_00240 TaxID=2903567 RepID=UPI002253044B|nr:divalent-cation tolerance protein CutA [Kitasatospora sp. NBC_00240]MCX5211009.1 divalent-cation tolerance protein CutA [Kitasatospora sp. NBC_00240]
MTTPEFIVATTTHDAEDKARALAAAVVGERLAACAQVSTVASVYRWEGTLRTDPEWRIDFKTRAELFDPLAAFVTAHHTYDTPEIIAVPLLAGSPDYLDWVRTETAG